MVFFLIIIHQPTQQEHQPVAFLLPANFTNLANPPETRFPIDKNHPITSLHHVLVDGC
jgi:hypothetical protein